MLVYKKRSGIYVFFLSIFIMLVAVYSAQADLLATSSGALDDDDPGAIRHYSNTGVYLGDFTSGGPELDGPTMAVFGPDGNLYVLTSSDTVLRYNGTTGAFLGVFIPTNNNGLDEAKDMIFGPDGNLYIASNCFDGGDGPDCPPGVVGEGGRVMRFNGTTGAFLGDFIPNGAGQGPPTNADTVCEAMSIAFGPDGFFYLGNDSRDCVQGTSYNVMRFDGTTGAYVDTPFPANSMGLYDPNGLTIGPDCNLYISSEGTSFTFDEFGSDNPNVIFRLNLTTGANTPGTIDEFVPSNGLLDDNGPFPPGTGLIEPEKIVFGPDGNFYVSSGDTREIYRYNGITGVLIGVFVTQGSGGLRDPKGLTFFPGESPVCGLVPVISTIPTLSEWGLIIMAGFIGLIGLWAVRRRKATA